MNYNREPGRHVNIQQASHIVAFSYTYYDRIKKACLLLKELHSTNTDQEMCTPTHKRRGMILNFCILPGDLPEVLIHVHAC